MANPKADHAALMSSIIAEARPGLMLWVRVRGEEQKTITKEEAARLDPATILSVEVAQGIQKRFPIALTAEQVALVLRGLSRVEKTDSDSATALGDELTDIHSMTLAGMSNDDIQIILEKGSY